MKADVGKAGTQTCPGKDVVVTPAEVVVPAAPVVIAQGTPLQITVNEALTSETAKEGQYVAALCLEGDVAVGVDDRERDGGVVVPE